ncbi:MAG: hypothetical protein KAH23_04295 [Kiritimatiellae bacterium]|nr:hypothetical protein [Kiritimatiellia bacterium]
MWTKKQIRLARKTDLVPLLKNMGSRLRPIKNGNTLVLDYHDLIVKQHYWTWPERNIQGNAIDFLILVQGKSFQQAMQILSEFIEDCGLPKEQENAAAVAALPLTTTAMGTNHDSNSGFTQNVND